MRISDWSSEVCSSDLLEVGLHRHPAETSIAIGIGDATVGEQVVHFLLALQAVDQLLRQRLLRQVAAGGGDAGRSDERRVGQQCGRPCRSRRLPSHAKRTNTHTTRQYSVSTQLN